MINPVGLLDIFISFLGFGNVHLFFQSFMERKLANNFTALFHASGCVSMTLLYFKDKTSLLHYIIKKFSSGYFLYDTLHTIKYRDSDISSDSDSDNDNTSYINNPNIEVNNVSIVIRDPSNNEL